MAILVAVLAFPVGRMRSLGDELRWAAGGERLVRNSLVCLSASMPIPVVCPSCKASFRVSDKFAGRQGPCPKCKATITVPDVAEEEIKIHAPEPAATGGKGQGAPSVKPITRKEAKLSTVALVAMLGVGLAVVLVALALRMVGNVPTALLAMGAGLLSPPLAVGCYALLRDDELEPYRGRMLWLRGIICGLVYAGTWAAFGWLLPIYLERPELWIWLFVLPPFFIIGGVAALACFDLDFGTGALHYGFYALVIVVLGWIAGVFPPAWVTG